MQQFWFDATELSFSLYMWIDVNILLENRQLSNSLPTWDFHVLVASCKALYLREEVLICRSTDVIVYIAHALNFRPTLSTRIFRTVRDLSLTFRYISRILNYFSDPYFFWWKPPKNVFMPFSANIFLYYICSASDCRFCVQLRSYKIFPTWSCEYRNQWTLQIYHFTSVGQRKYPRL